MKQIKNLIFDIDGTLIDTFNMYMPTLFKVLANHGFHFRNPDQLAKQFYGIDANSALRKLKIPEADIPAINHEWIEEAYRHFDLVTVLPGISKTINQLAQNKNIVLGIVTSKTHAEYDSYFRDKYPFAPAFSTVITATDTTKHKPDPTPIKLWLKNANALPEESIYIGDMPTDLQAAHQAGIKFATACYRSSSSNSLMGADYQLLTPSDIINKLPILK